MYTHTHIHTYTHTHTHTHTHTRTHARTHARTHPPAHTHTLTHNTIQYNTIQLYFLYVEKFAFWLVIYIKTFNTVNNKTSTTQ